MCVSGFVQGEAGTEPRLMQFNPNYQHGAQLTVVSLLFTFAGLQSFRRCLTVLLKPVLITLEFTDKLEI